MVGYSVAELDDVQAKWGFRFPPDLIERLRERRLVVDAPDCFDWIKADAKHIRKCLAWPFESYWGSVERHEIWWPEWGERPSSLADQRKSCAASSQMRRNSFRLRYIPDEPHESGNPIFSVMASDIIHYGANLIHWLERERGRLQGKVNPWPPIKEIRFWGQAVRYGNDEGSIVRHQIGAAIARRKRSDL